MIEIENLVVGAGLSGLMAGYLLKRKFLILDAADGPKIGVSAPFYLHAPLDWLPTQWKEIDVHHNVWDGENFHRAPTIKMMNDYSRKITGKIIDTSLKFMDGGVKRGFLPADGGAQQILQDLYEDVKDKISWGAKIISIDPSKREVTYQLNLPGATKGEVYQYRYRNMISTMPLPALLALSGQAMPCNFRADPIYTSVWEVPESDTTETFQIVYVTDRTERVYRASLMGNRIILESMREIEDQNLHAMQLIQRLWDLRDVKWMGWGTIKPGKFHPITESQRKAIVNKLTTESGIYSLGRYATWAYKRIDHISADAHAIVKMIKAQS